MNVELNSSLESILRQISWEYFGIMTSKNIYLLDDVIIMAEGNERHIIRESEIREGLQDHLFPKYRQ